MMKSEQPVARLESRAPKMEPGLRLALAAIAVLLVGTGGLTYRNVHALYQRYERISHSWEVLTVLEEVVSTMKDAETGQRGYLITGDASYLEPYESASASIAGALGELKRLTRNNPRAQSSIPRLEGLVSEEFGELEKSIDLRSRDAEAAWGVVRTGRGKASMDAIRAQVDAIRSLYEVLLDERERGASSVHWTAVASTIATTSIGLSMLVAFTLVLRRHLQARHQAALEIQTVNDSLERRVEERTAEAERKAVQLRKMAAKLAQVEQSERRRLSQALHDNLQQLLVAAKMIVERLRDRLDDPVACDLVDDIDSLLEESVGEARSLTVQLSPPVLYEGGLAAGLKWLGRQVCQRHGLEVEVEGERCDDPKDEPTRVFLFEAARELLFNVVKHAHAKRARVTMTRTAECTRIDVTDDGIGVTPGETGVSAGTDGGFGLFSIRERLEVLGGSMTVESPPGGGTKVSVEVPASAS